MKKIKIKILVFLLMLSLKLSAQGSDPFLGQIMWVPYNFAPKGWAGCNGQILSIAQNQALFSLLGTTYGGNGSTTFALPNIQSRVLLGDGSAYTLGQNAGEENHTLTLNEMPAHNHLLNAVTSDGNKSSPEGNLPANTKVLDKEYASYGSGNMTTMNNGVVGATGGNLPHNNLQPYVTFKCIIALQGIFPSRN